MINKNYMSSRLQALQLYKIRNKDKKFQRLPGPMSQFTEEQLFFISFANVSQYL